MDSSYKLTPPTETDQYKILRAGIYLILSIFPWLALWLYPQLFQHNITHPELKESDEKSERFLLGDLLVHSVSSLLDRDCSMEHSNFGQTLEEPNST